MSENELTMKDLNSLSLKKLTTTAEAHVANKKQKIAIENKQQAKEKKAEFNQFKKAALKLIPKALVKYVGKIHYGDEQYTTSKRPYLIVILPKAHAPIRLNFVACDSNDGIDVSWSKHHHSQHSRDTLSPIKVGYPSHYQLDEFSDDENLHIFTPNWELVGWLRSEFSPNLLLEAIHIVRSPDMKDKYEKNAEEIKSLNKNHLAKIQAEKDRVAKIEEAGGRIVSDEEFRSQLHNSPPLDQIAYWLTIIGKRIEEHIKNYHGNY